MNNFKLIRTENISELNTKASIYQHIPTGAEILSMENDDENKCFGISFRTPPEDSTGVAHILEHTVLCGSRKYPVKDPFVQMLKGSLQTYLNAFTYPDKTCYPVASQNLQDFYNLVDVYLDAVFYPRITKDFFMQEGWHFMLQSPEDPLLYKGVVYNEMKGVYSSPDSLLMESSQQSLFPNTTYGLDSGGNPKHIPDLTYEQFKAFHQSHYHPSNARIFFYGDDPVEKRFEIIEAYLKDYTAIDPNSDIADQPKFMEPKRIEKPFSVSEDDENPTPMFTVNWLLPQPTDPELHLAFRLLDHVLLGTPASPLRKALIESGLGEDLTGGGLETHMKQMTFSIGLKGVQNADLQPAEKLIEDTLKQLVKDGISRDDIGGALNTLEFDLRENNSGGFPRGLSLMLRALNVWIYDADPLALIAFEQPLQAVKSTIQQNDRFFEELIQEYFLSNTHRTTVTLRPDAALAKRTEQEETERLAAIKATLSPDQIQQIIEQTKRLQELQSTPDSAEDIARIPLLKRKDLEPTIKTVDHECTTRHGVSVLKHNLFTNGILYLDIGFDLRALTQEDLPYAAMLGNILLEMGTEQADYVTLSQRIAAKTGGIYGAPMLAARDDSPDGVTRFFLRSKCMFTNTDALLAILEEILLKPNFNNRERFKQIVLEHKSEMETALVPRGHSAVMTRLKARYHLAHWTAEQLGGVDALFFARKLASDIEQDWEAVQKRLKRLHNTLLNRNHLIVNITADPSELPALETKLDTFLEKLPVSDAGQVPKWMPESLPTTEALSAPSRVNYVGASANLFKAGYVFHGSALVITRYLQTSWLWEKIRVQGGAYGGMCAFDQRSGAFVFASYRDPNLKNSLEVYQQTGSFLENIELSEDELTRAIIGAIGQLDAYQLPDAKGYTNTLRFLLDYSDEERQKLRNEVLTTTPAHFRAFGAALTKAMTHPEISVLCSPESADEARQQGVDLETDTRVL